MTQAIQCYIFCHRQICAIFSNKSEKCLWQKCISQTENCETPNCTKQTNYWALLKASEFIKFLPPKIYRGGEKDTATAQLVDLFIRHSFISCSINWFDDQGNQINLFSLFSKEEKTINKFTCLMIHFVSSLTRSWPFSFSP